MVTVQHDFYNSSTKKMTTLGVDRFKNSSVRIEGTCRHSQRQKVTSWPSIGGTTPTKLSGSQMSRVPLSLRPCLLFVESVFTMLYYDHVVLQFAPSLRRKWKRSRQRHRDDERTSRPVKRNLQRRQQLLTDSAAPP